MSMILAELKEIAEGLSINNVLKLGKQELIHAILDAQAISSSKDATAEPRKGGTREKARKKKREKASEKAAAPVSTTAPKAEMIVQEEIPFVEERHGNRNST
jgi:hypothetical protein